MIKTKTLFILGAGASAPFGYPTGTKLRELIRQGNCNADIIEALMPAYGRNDDKWYEASVANFVSEFSNSGIYSIDFFLEHRSEFMDIGKMAIAAYLIMLEKDEKLRDLKDNWYMYLYDRLKSSFEKFNQNNIAFITFNYDRSLEQFLFGAIKSQFGKHSYECSNMLKRISIVHLYGQLDPLPWQSVQGVSYSSVDGISIRIKNARKNIKLISDERDINNSEEFKQAYELIKWSEKIYFLGFGFDEINIERLNINLMKDKPLIATALEIEGSKQRWLNKYFKDKIDTNLYLHNLDALSLLKEDLKIQ